MKINFIYISLAVMFVSVSIFDIASAVVNPIDPPVYQSPVEGSSDVSGEAPSVYQSPVEGNSDSSGDVPPVYQSPVEGNIGPSSDNANGGSSSRGNRSSRNTSGQVLGATTDSETCQILTTYMKRGMNNDVFEVIVLQAFLNKEMNAGLPLTGFFGPLTEQAVKNFQIKYASEILLPWFNVGLASSPDVPTGYVYKTTLHKINSILCSDIIIPAPVLN